VKALKPIITLLAIGAIAFGIYYLFFPPAEKVIRKRLGKLAAAISTRPQGNIATIANVNKIGSYFHPNVSITIEGFGREFGSVQGRGELQQMALAARQRVGSVTVEFYNINIQVGSEKTNATASATALVKVGEETNPAVQELNFQFEKFQREWLIRSAVPANPAVPL